MHSLYSQTFRIYAPEVDFGGVMYHANYLKFADYTRSAFLNANGYTQKFFQEKEQYFMVHKCRVEYKKPALIEDFIRCELSFPIVKKASFLANHKIFNHNTNELLCIVDTDMVFVKKTGNENDIKPCQMDENLHTLFSSASNPL